MRCVKIIKEGVIYGFLEYISDFYKIKVVKYGENIMEFEIFDHTADHGIKAYGKTLSEVFVNSSRAFAKLSTDPEKVKAEKEFVIEISRDETDELLVAWLNELIFIQDTEEVYLSRFEVDVNPPDLKGKVWGEEIDMERHTQRACIKAATYHGLKLEKTKKGWMGQVIFDV